MISNSKDFSELKGHIGHKLSCVSYSDDDGIVEVSIECEDCQEVLCSVPMPGSVNEVKEDIPCPPAQDLPEDD